MSAAPVPPRRITGEPPGWEGTRALHERHLAAVAPNPHPVWCAICFKPETPTTFGRFTVRWGEQVHKGCALDIDSDMAP